MEKEFKGRLVSVCVCLQVLYKENQIGHTLHCIMVLYLLFCHLG